MEYKLYKRFHEVVPARYVVCFLSFIFGFHVFSFRGVMSISLLAMTRTPSRNHTITECPFPENSEHILARDSNRYLHQFDWNQKQRGLILSSYFIGITVTQLLGGIISNHFSPKRLVAFGVFISAILCLVMPTVAYHGYWIFLALWVLVGFSSGMSISPMYAFLGRWSPASERGIIFSMLFVGFTVGSVVGQIGSGYIITSMNYRGDGWKYPFYIFGSLACVWCIVWSLIIANSPQEHVAISEKELCLLTSELGNQANNDNVKVPWLAILTSVPFWAMVGVDFSAHWTMDFFQTQIPNFYANMLHHNISESGLFSSLPFIVYAVFSFSSGTISVWLHSKWDLSTNCSRKLFTSIAVFGYGALTLGIGYKCDVTLNTALLTASLGMLGFYTSGNFCTATDMSPRFSGVIFGISNTISNFGGFVCPALVGYVVSQKNNLEGWRYVFLISSCFSFGSGVIYLFFGSSQLQPWANGCVNLKPQEKNESTENWVMDPVVLKCE